MQIVFPAHSQQVTAEVWCVKAAPTSHGALIRPPSQGPQARQAVAGRETEATKRDELVFWRVLLPAPCSAAFLPLPRPHRTHFR
jgi:hypothetical protein